jgi:N-acetylglutamate synthase-like GNAT family acetyltransferase
MSKSSDTSKSSDRSKSGYSFYLSKWKDHQDKIQHIREKVFVKEFGLPTTRIQHGLDADCYHVLAYDNSGNTIGTGCIHPNGEIGQIAVLSPWRGRTVGKAILVYLLHVAKTLHLPSVWVNAIEPTTRFYQSKDFDLTDESTLIEGVRYRKMVHLIEHSKTIN